MFQHQGIWLPDGEKHFPDWMTKNGELVDGLGTYQIKKYREAIKWCKDFRFAIDVGAHVGMWSMQMRKKFRLIYAFEPVFQMRECFHANLRDVKEDIGNVVLFSCALGSRDCVNVGIHYDPADSGGTHVKGTGDVAVRILDTFPLPSADSGLVLDFVKIDCEGYEHEVVKGAAETLQRYKPCVIVEQKPHKLGPNFGIQGTPAVDLLKQMGARVAKEMSGDFIMVWD